MAAEAIKSVVAVTHWLTNFNLVNCRLLPIKYNVQLCYVKTESPDYYIALKYCLKFSRFAIVATYTSKYSVEVQNF